MVGAELFLQFARMLDESMLLLPDGAIILPDEQDFFSATIYLDVVN